MENKVLGIIGGMGPFADLLFLQFLQRFVSRQSQNGDSSCIPVILDGNCNRPDRSDYLTGKSDISPLPSLLSSLIKLKNCGAQVIAMPCNTSHAFFDMLVSSGHTEGLTFINMPKETSDLMPSKGVKFAGILCTEGTSKAKIYDKYLFKHGIKTIYPAEDEQENLTSVIKEVKNGGDGNIHRYAASLISKGADCVIVGCTELSLLLYRHPETRIKYIDALSVLAKRSILLTGHDAIYIPYT